VIVRYTTDTFIGLILIACGFFVEGVYIESWVARFMDFWMPNTKRRPKTAVRIARRFFYTLGALFVIFAVLYRTRFF
jgi:hypothetical protein